MSFKKIVYAFLLLLPFYESASAQEVLLEQEVIQDTIIHRLGPNYRHFHHTYIGYGFIIPFNGNNLTPVKAGLSRQIVVGYRYKLKLTKWYALGIDISYSNLSYSINQLKTKTFTTSILHYSEKLVVNSLLGGLYNRFNFEKRGNVIGTFLDIGAFYQWNYVGSHTYVDKYTSINGDNALLTKVTNKKLQYINNFNYGLTARLGHNNFCFFANYYLDNFFVSTYNYQELPKIVVGFQIGLHN